MKWRTTTIYFLVLLLIGGVYLVLEKKQKEDARKEKESKHVFIFDEKVVKEIEIRSGEAKEIHLVKDQKWRISQPISSDVDITAFDGFFSVLRNIEFERKIGKPTDNLEPFGLNKPFVVVRVLAGSDWLELQVGGKNPTESARYARIGDGGDIFLLSNSICDALNRSLKDFRRKELFAFQPDEVTAVDVKWKGGEALNLKRDGGAKVWKIQSQPDMKISTRKVEAFLTELHWLRAVDFPENEAVPSPAQVEVSLKLKDGRTPDLKIANPDSAKKQAMASSSEIEVPVRIPMHILDTIPKSAAAVEDRYIYSGTNADIRQITWKTPEGGGNLVWINDDRWGKKEGDAAPKAIDDSNSVRQFLAELENVEYISVVEPAPNAPEPTANTVHFTDVLGVKGSLSWDKLPSEPKEPVTAWLEKDGRTCPVKLPHDEVQRLGVLLADMAKNVPGGKQKQ